MSKLLKQAYSSLGIKRLWTTPYYPQTDGLTEGFNQTLKQMLKKFVSETGTTGFRMFSLPIVKSHRPQRDILHSNCFMAGMFVVPCRC